jgi:hypothetical protein
MIIGDTAMQDVVLEFLDKGITRDSTGASVSCQAVALVNKILAEGKLTKVLKPFCVSIFDGFTGLSSPRLTEEELIKKFGVDWGKLRRSILSVVDYLSKNAILFRLSNEFVNYRKVNQIEESLTSYLY